MEKLEALERLSKLLESGRISQSEFDELKAEVLAGSENREVRLDAIKEVGGEVDVNAEAFDARGQATGSLLRTAFPAAGWLTWFSYVLIAVGIVGIIKNLILFGSDGVSELLLALVIDPLVWIGVVGLLVLIMSVLLGESASPPTSDDGTDFFDIYGRKVKPAASDDGTDFFDIYGRYPHPGSGRDHKVNVAASDDGTHFFDDLYGRKVNKTGAPPEEIPTLYIVALGLGIVSVLFGGTFGLVAWGTVAVGTWALSSLQSQVRGRWMAWVGLGLGIVFSFMNLYLNGHLDTLFSRT